MSDDELAAAAMRLGGEWKGSLPTIDVRDPNSLLQAVARGHRSLVLRGLLSGAEGDELADVVAKPLAPAVGRIPEQLGYAALSSDLYTVSGAQFAVFAAGAGAKLVVVTSPNGINELSVMTSDAAREFVEAFAHAARAAGDPQRSVVLLAQRGAASADFAVAGADGMTSGSGSVDVLDLEAGQPTSGLPISLLPL